MRPEYLFLICARLVLIPRGGGPRVLLNSAQSTAVHAVWWPRLFSIRPRRVGVPTTMAYLRPANSLVPTMITQVSDCPTPRTIRKFKHPSDPNWERSNVPTDSCISVFSATWHDRIPLQQAEQERGSDDLNTNVNMAKVFPRLEPCNIRGYPRRERSLSFSANKSSDDRIPHGQQPDLNDAPNSLTSSMYLGKLRLKPGSERRTGLHAEPRSRCSPSCRPCPDVCSFPVGASQKLDQIK